MSDIKVKFSSDTTGVNQGVAKVNASLKSVQGVAKDVGNTIKSALGPLTIITGAIAGAATLGSKSLIDYGSTLQDLSDTTGIAIDQLVILEEAFERAGMSAQDIEPALVKMTRSLEDPSKNTLEWLDTLGIKLSEIKGLSMAEQFKKIGSAIGGLDTQQKKIAATTAIFGKGAADLVRVFQDGDAFKTAEDSVGGLAERMLTLSPTLEKLGDAIGNIKKKFMDFFAYFAEKYEKEIKQFTEWLENLKGADLAKKLEDGGVAKTIEDILKTVFSSPPLKNALKDTFVFAANEAVATIKNGVGGLWNSGTEGKVVLGGAAAVASVSIGGKVLSHWDKIVNFFKSGFRPSVDTGKFTIPKGGGALEPAVEKAGWMRRYLGKTVLAGAAMDIGDKYFKRTMDQLEMIRKSGPLGSKPAIFRKYTDLDSWDIMKESWAIVSKEREALDKILEREDDIFNQFIEGLSDLDAKSYVDKYFSTTPKDFFDTNISDYFGNRFNDNAKDRQYLPPEEEQAKQTLMFDAYKPVVDSLARVGGARGLTSNPMVSLQKITNDFLSRIEKNTRSNVQVVASWGG